MHSKAILVKFLFFLDKVEEYSDKCRNGVNLSIDSFVEVLNSLSTKDIKPLLDLWVFRPGVARLNCTFSFNRKKNTIELEIKQDMINQKGYKKYAGPITLIVQETEGSYTHSLQIESDQVSSKFDIACHSKGKNFKSLFKLYVSIQKYKFFVT